MAIKKDLLKTLAYSDIFDYPLTKDEVWQFLISNKGSTLKETSMGLSKGSTLIHKNGFYCFLGRTEIINKRLEREMQSDKKLKLAKKISSKLSIIPTIKLIAISGALAMKNSDSDDDIDFFVITKKNKLWTTRLLVLFLLQIFGYRRKRKDKKFANKVCLNMVVDESSISLSKERQDLYTAHEIVQMMPVFDRDNTYQKFIQANLWVKEYLPNFRHRTNQNHTQNHTEQFFSIILGFVSFSAIEKLSKTIQLTLIKRHQTIEEVSDSLLAFHPIDYKNNILKMYNKKLKEHGI